MGLESHECWEDMAVKTHLIRNAHEAERRWFYGGGLHTWLVRQKEVDGDFLLFEDEVEPGKCTPLHTHPQAEETFYLLAGSMLLHVDGTEAELRAGGVAVIPREMPHAFLAGSDGARMLCLHTPGVARTSTGRRASRYARASRRFRSTSIGSRRQRWSRAP